MGPIKAVALGYFRMFNFSGRSRRAEFWWFSLWQIAIGAGVGGWAGAQLARMAEADPAFARSLQDPVAAEAYFRTLIAGYELPILVGYLLLIVLPNLSLTVRRLHDTDRSGWRIFMPSLVGLVSGFGGGILMGASAASGSAGGAMVSMAVTIVPVLIASIWFFVWLCLPGTHGPNRFGGDPIKNRKEVEPSHPAFAAPVMGARRDRSDEARKAAARDYYKRHVLPSIQRPEGA